MSSKRKLDSLWTLEQHSQFVEYETIKVNEALSRTPKAKRTVDSDATLGAKITGSKSAEQIKRYRRRLKRRGSEFTGMLPLNIADDLRNKSQKVVTLVPVPQTQPEAPPRLVREVCDDIQLVDVPSESSGLLEDNLVDAPPLPEVFESLHSSVLHQSGGSQYAELQATLLGQHISGQHHIQTTTLSSELVARSIQEMENHAEIRKVERLQKKLTESLTTIDTSLGSLEKLREGLQAQVDEHFEVLAKALIERKAALKKHVDDHVNGLRLSLQQQQEKTALDIQVCSQTVVSAKQMYGIMPEMAVHFLQGVKSISVSNATIPETNLQFLPSLDTQLKSYGELVFGSHIAGTDKQGFADGKGNKATFNSPFGITYNPRDGNCYIADSQNNMIRKVSPNGVVSIFAGTGEAGWVDGPIATAKFNLPMSIAVNKQTGDLYVSDRFNHRIRKISPDGIVSTVAGNGKPTSVDGPALNASLCHPWGLHFDERDGSIIIADHNNHKTRKLTPQGELITLAGSGAPQFVDGAGVAAHFSSLAGIDIHPVTGDIYVADRDNNRIRKISPDGVVSTVAGTGEASSRDGNIASATFNKPTDVKISHKDGALLVADHPSNQLRKIHQDVVSTIPWPQPEPNETPLRFPVAISIDQTNNVCYVLERLGIVKRLYL